jgi:hypothetical protein
MEWDLGRRLVLEWGQRLFLCSLKTLMRHFLLLGIVSSHSYCERHTCVGAYVGNRDGTSCAAVRWIRSTWQCDFPLKVRIYSFKLVRYSSCRDLEVITIASKARIVRKQDSRKIIRLGKEKGDRSEVRPGDRRNSFMTVSRPDDSLGEGRGCNWMRGVTCKMDELAPEPER